MYEDSYKHSTNESEFLQTWYSWMRIYVNLVLKKRIPKTKKLMDEDPFEFDTNG